MIEQESNVYLPPFYYSEIGVARRIKQIKNTDNQNSLSNIGFEKALSTLQKQTNITYDDIQIEAIKLTTSSKFCVITGGPGTGKTTTTKAIIDLFALSGKTILLAAPTGRAAKRMSEATGMEAKTIHRLLESKPPEGFAKNADNPLEGDVIVDLNSQYTQGTVTGNQDFPNQELQTSENRKSRLPDSGGADSLEADANKTNNNQLDVSSFENQSIYPKAHCPVAHHPISYISARPAERCVSSFATYNNANGDVIGNAVVSTIALTNTIDNTLNDLDTYREIIKDNIAYSHLCAQNRHKAGVIDELVELMVEVVCSNKKTVRISGEEMPIELVKSRFLKLDNDHIEYILECLDKSPSDIRNIKSYLLTTLYNAPSTIVNYYRAAVNYDLRE